MKSEAGHSSVGHELWRVLVPLFVFVSFATSIAAIGIWILIDSGR
jgi:hypothetical protein